MLYTGGFNIITNIVNIANESIFFNDLMTVLSFKQNMYSKILMVILLYY